MSDTGLELGNFGYLTLPSWWTNGNTDAQTLYRVLQNTPDDLKQKTADQLGISLDQLMSPELWNSGALNNYASQRVAIGNKENMLGDLMEGLAWVGGGALGINSIFNPAGVSGLFGGSETLGSIGGTDTVALNAADQAAGLLPAESLSTGATALPVDLSTVVGTDLPALDTIGTGANEMSVWDDIANEVIGEAIGENTLNLGDLALQDFNDFGVTGVEALGDSLNYATTASDLTNGISWQSQLADTFRSLGLDTNTALNLTSSAGANGEKLLNLFKSNAGKTLLGSLSGTGSSLKNILGGIIGLYGSQNQAQDLKEAAKYLTENANPYRSYIQNGTVGGPGSVTSFMQGFQQPANQMASASGGYNDLLKTSYTDPLSIWNSPEMSALNNIFKQQIDRRDSVAGRNSQYGARAVEMQNNFLTNALPKYRTGLNEALNATSNAATNFGKVATPPGTGEAPASVGNLLQGAATAGNSTGWAGSVLDNLFS